MMVDVMDLREGPLEKEGWERRSILDEPRLSEVVMMYEEMGLEVLVTDLSSEPAEGCRVCAEGREDVFKVVYTRKKVKEGR